MTKKVKLKRIGLLSAVKIGGIVSAVMGFAVGTVWGIGLAFFSSIIGAAFSMDTSGFGIAWLIISPVMTTLLYGCIGVFFSFLGALVYNIAAGLLGGIELEAEDIAPKIYNDIYDEM